MCPRSRADVSTAYAANMATELNVLEVSKPKEGSHDPAETNGIKKRIYSQRGTKRSNDGLKSCRAVSTDKESDLVKLMPLYL